MKYIESLEDFEELMTESENSICVVDIFAEWCGPCKRIAPTFEKVAEEHTSFRFFKYDADLNLDVEELRVSSLPTFLVFHQRKIINTLVGGNIERFLSMINEL